MSTVFLSVNVVLKHEDRTGHIEEIVPFLTIANHILFMSRLAITHSTAVK